MYVSEIRVFPTSIRGIMIPPWRAVTVVGVAVRTQDIYIRVRVYGYRNRFMLYYILSIEPYTRRYVDRHRVSYDIIVLFYFSRHFHTTYFILLRYVTVDSRLSRLVVNQRNMKRGRHIPRAKNKYSKYDNMYIIFSTVQRTCGKNNVVRTLTPLTKSQTADCNQFVSRL